jgi:toxin HigB-1
VQLAFAKKALRELCENEARAQSELGARVTEKLKRRLADFRAAGSVKDLVAGRPRELEGGRPDHKAVDLCEGYRIIFCVNHNAIPVLECGAVNWSKVNRVKIVEIERDYG